MEPVAIYGKLPKLGSDYGYGPGLGYGYGYGYGYGDGSGDGYGYGDGSGDGYGSGDGSGDGDGSGLKEATLGFVEMLPKIRRTRAKKLIRDGAKIAYWKSDINGKPANGGTGEPVHVGHIDVITGPVKLCTKAALHATYNLEKWRGERIWLVALSGEIKEEQDKLGATQREILAELTGGKLL